MSAEESFTITVLHNGIQRELAGILRISAYTHQFLFKIGDAEVILERDDEGGFRARISPESMEAGRKPDPSLVRVLTEELERVMKA